MWGRLLWLRVWFLPVSYKPNTIIYNCIFSKLGMSLYWLTLIENFIGYLYAHIIQTVFGFNISLLSFAWELYLLHFFINLLLPQLGQLLSFRGLALPQYSQTSGFGCGGGGGRCNGIVYPIF